MASAISPLPMTWAPLQAFASWLFRKPEPKASARPLQPADQVGAIQKPSAAQIPLRAASVVRPATRKGRVLRVYGGPTRMVISGRMADVCAELDRLAALESQPSRPRR